MPTLSKRLKLIFDQLIPQEAVWDICCDHGYLGLQAYNEKKFTDIYFVDQIPEIIDRLREHFFKIQDNNPPPHNVQFLALAAEDLDMPLTGNVIICGVGSYTIYKILNSLNQKKLLNAQRLILCPQNDVIKIDDLKSITQFSYELSCEAISVSEKNRIRKIYVFDRT